MSVSEWLASRFRREIRRAFAGSSRLLFACLLVGLITGFAAAAFFLGLEYMGTVCQGRLAGLSAPRPEHEQIDLTEHVGAPAPSPRLWLIVALPALGGLASGLLVYKLAPETAGAGVEAMIRSFHHGKGQVRARVAPVKAIASVLTLGTGGSGGRQGPIAQIGSALGALIARSFNFSPKEARLLLLAGAAGGIGALFRAPLGGALMAVEVLYHDDFETDAIVPCVISSVAAYAVYTYFFASEQIFGVPDIQACRLEHLLFYSFLAVVASLLARIYVLLFLNTRHLFGRLRLPNYLKPMLGGLLVGLLGLAVPEALGTGWGYLQEALRGSLMVKMMVTILLYKMVTSALTIGSGGSGGMFGPSLLVGGLLGGALGKVFLFVFPGAAPSMAGCVAIGMASFFAGVTHTPIASLVIVCEMTDSYRLLAPLMIANVISLLMTRGRSLYSVQVQNRFCSPAHADSVTVDLLAEITVEEAYGRRPELKTISVDMKLRELRAIIADDAGYLFPVPVRDEEGRLAGILTLGSIRENLFDEELSDTLSAGKMMGPLASCTPSDDLHTAFMKFWESGHGRIPVVADGDPDRILGLLAYQDIIRAYNQEIEGRGES